MQTEDIFSARCLLEASCRELHAESEAVRLLGSQACGSLLQSPHPLTFAFRFRRYLQLRRSWQLLGGADARAANFIPPVSLLPSTLRLQRFLLPYSAQRGCI